MERYLIPAEETRCETRVMNSRFIATVAPAFTADEAKAFIARIKHEFANATHNVSAYLIGHGNTVIAHCHDDGEPSGTAGRPALAVLRGSGLGDVAVVVTRRFGGTKLGRGGLVRAYRDAVRNVLTLLPRAAKVPTCVAVMTMPYSFFECICLLVATHRGRILHKEFAAEVALKARFAVERFPAFQEAVRDVSKGTLRADIIRADELTIVPIDVKERV